VKLTGFGATHIGKTRDHNEDSYLVDDDLGLYAVCDGMGGYLAGEVASRQAAESLRDHVRNSSSRLEGIRRDSVADSQMVRFVEEVVNASCAEVHRLADTKLEYHKMGTTLTFLLGMADRAVMGHVGDSRLYLVRDEQAYQLSDDHTYATDLMRAGVISPDAVRTHQFSHVLTRAVGSKEAVPVDTLLFDLLPGDVLILCSDGLSYYMESAEDLLETLDSTELPDVPGKLVELANSRGGRDNISVIAVDVDPGHRPAGEAGERTRLVLECVEAVKRMPLFTDLAMRDLLRIANIADVQEVGEGERVCDQGQMCQDYSLVLNGELMIGGTSCRDRGLTAGDVFGLDAVLDDCRMHVSVQAVRPSKVLRIPRAGLERIARRRPRLGLKVYRNLSRELARRLKAGRPAGGGAQ